MRRLGIAALVVASLVPIAASFAAVAPGWRPRGDTAIISTRARDVFTGETPLLGQPSTAGIGVGKDVSHPGPLEFWAIALGQRVDDHPAVSLVVVALVNAIAVGAAVVLAARAGGVGAAALTAVLFALLGWSLRGEILVDPWNPFAAVLPFAGFVVALLAAVAGRRWWALVPAVLLGSYAAQAHLVFAPLVMAGAIAAVVASIVAGTRPSWREIRTPLLVALVVGLLAWTAPIVDVIGNDGGNVTAVLAASGSRDGGSQRGLGHAVDDTVRAASWRPAWAQAGQSAPSLLLRPSGADRLLVAALLVLAVGLAAVAHRRGRRELTAVAIVTISLLVAGTAVRSRLPDAFFNVFGLGNVLWLWPATAFLWATVVLGAVVVAGRRAARPAMAGAAVILATVAVACLLDPVHRPIHRADARYVAVLGDAAARTLDHGDRYRFELTGDLTGEANAGAVDKGVLDELARRGFDLRVTPFFARSYGWRAAAGDRVEGVLSVRVGDDTETALTADETVVARYRPPAKMIRLLADAEAGVVRRIETSGGLDEDLFPAFGLPTPPTAAAFVADNFLTMAQAGFLGREIAAWPETSALADARLEAVEPVTLVLRRL